MQISNLIFSQAHHDYPHNVPLINSLLHNARDYKPFASILQYNSGYCDYYCYGKRCGWGKSHDKIFLRSLRSRTKPMINLILA